MTSASELNRLSDIQYELKQNEDAFDTIIKCLKLEKKLDEQMREKFTKIVKSSIDPIRYLMRKLDYYQIEYSADAKNVIEFLFRKYREKLEKLCNETLDIIDDDLLPENESDSDNYVFLYKMKGDLYRYILEFTKDEEAKKTVSEKADESYKKSLDHAAANMNISDHTYLGVILNHAVYLYEHKDMKDEANEILVSTLDKLKDCGELSDETNEVKKIIQCNIDVWNGEKQYEMEDEGEEEEEDRATGE